jgi:hypothetical protein
MMKLTNVFGQESKNRKQVIKPKSGGNFISITSSNSSEFVLILYSSINVFIMTHDGRNTGKEGGESRQREAHCVQKLRFTEYRAILQRNWMETIGQEKIRQGFILWRSESKHRCAKARTNITSSGQTVGANPEASNTEVPQPTRKSMYVLVLLKTISHLDSSGD